MVRYKFPGHIGLMVIKIFLFFCFVLFDNLNSFHFNVATGGKLNDFGNRHDFEDCLTTKECAERTVANYMKKFGQDCNADGLIDCIDFAILHKTGYRNCYLNAIENTKYWKDFTKTQCFKPIGN